MLASVAMAALSALQVRIRDASHVDVAWAILIACAALAYALFADGDIAHRVLTAALAAIWGFRLGLYLLFNGVLGKDEDGRYQAALVVLGGSGRAPLFPLPRYQYPGHRGAGAPEPRGLCGVPANDECLRAARPADDYAKRQPSPSANDLRIRRATTMRCTSSGPS
jgi:Protein of unknown function (DUF1295)